MLYEPKIGRPLSYVKEKHFDKYVQGVRDTLSLTHGSELADVPAATGREWVIQGDKDRKEGKWTELAQLSGAVRKAQSECAAQMIQEGKRGKNNYKFIQWLLTVCFREDYSFDSDTMRNLIDKAQEVGYRLKRLEENPVNRE